MSPEKPSSTPVFATTHWSVVVAAGQADPIRAAQALEELCRTYWYPLYAYLRRRGLSDPDAQDATQGLFAQLIERDSFRTVSIENGRFRSFLLASLNYFLADQRDKAGAAKRGGGERPLRPCEAGLRPGAIQTTLIICFSLAACVPAP